MTSGAGQAGELYRPVALERITSSGSEHLVEASPAECALIALRLQIPAVLTLECRFSLRRHSDTVDADGLLRALVVRECVISLEPFESAIRESFQIRFVPAGSEPEDDPLAVDELAYSAGRLDLGEAAVEQLALSLDPYPRRPDAVLPEPDAAEQAGHPLDARDAGRRSH